MSSNPAHMTKNNITTNHLAAPDEEALIRPLSGIYFKNKFQEILDKILEVFNEYANLPYLILGATLLQILFYTLSTDLIAKDLRFEPRKRLQIWRYITYMLIHDNLIHLSLNCTLQCVFAYFLKKYDEKCVQMGIVYIGGGATGALGASVLNSGILIGASAGVYALLLSGVANIILNFRDIRKRKLMSVCIAIIIISDVTYNFFHCVSKREPRISWEAHLFGGITGLFLGLMVYETKGTKKQIIISAAILYVVLVLTLIVLAYVVQMCSPKNSIYFLYYC